MRNRMNIPTGFGGSDKISHQSEDIPTQTEGNLSSGGSHDQFINPDEIPESQAPTVNESDWFPDNIKKYAKWGGIALVGIILIILGFRMFGNKKPKIKLKGGK